MLPTSRGGTITNLLNIGSRVLPPPAGATVLTRRPKLGGRRAGLSSLVHLSGSTRGRHTRRLTFSPASLAALLEKYHAKSGIPIDAARCASIANDLFDLVGHHAELMAARSAAHSTAGEAGPRTAGVAGPTVDMLAAGIASAAIGQRAPSSPLTTGTRSPKPPSK